MNGENQALHSQDSHRQHVAALILPTTWSAVCPAPQGGDGTGMPGAGDQEGTHHARRLTTEIVPGSSELLL